LVFNFINYPLSIKLIPVDILIQYCYGYGGCRGLMKAGTKESPGIEVVFSVLVEEV